MSAAENIAHFAKGAAGAAAIITGICIHQSLAADHARANAPAPAETLIPCEVRDGILVCDGRPTR